MTATSTMAGIQTTGEEGGESLVQMSENQSDQLPNEVLLRIFSHLDMSDPNNFGMLQVNSRFRHLCSASVTRLKLPSQLQMPTARAKSLLDLSSAGLTHLDLTERWTTTTAGNGFCNRSGHRDCASLAIRAMRRCPKLEELRLADCNNGPWYEDGERQQQQALMLNAISKSSRDNCLRRVVLASADFRIMTPDVVAGALGRMERLKLVSCGGVNDDVLEALGRHCEALTEFSTDSGEFSDEAGRNFLENVKDRIESLEFLGRTPEDFGRQFYRDLRRCAKLRRLLLGSAKGLNLRGLSEILVLPDLKTLTVKENKMNDNDDDEEEEYEDDEDIALRRWRTAASPVEKLSLPKQMDNFSLRAIIQNCPNLRHLTLEYSFYVDDRGIRCVVLDCGRKLEELFLNNLTEVTEEWAFKDARLYLPRLRTLGLVSCDVDRRSRDEICHELGLVASSDDEPEVFVLRRSGPPAASVGTVAAYRRLILRLATLCFVMLGAVVIVKVRRQEWF